MYFNLKSKSLLVGLSVALSLMMSQLVYAQEQSFRSYNFPDRYIRHRNSLGYIEVITAKDKLGRKDATFKIVPGLAGRCHSFESVNYPDHFLRHENFRLKLAKRTNDELFKKDATFCIKRGLASSNGRSFESINFPNHYIRHSNFELWLHRSDGSNLFKKDATFIPSRPLTEYPPPVRID